LLGSILLKEIKEIPGVDGSDGDIAFDIQFREYLDICAAFFKHALFK